MNKGFNFLFEIIFAIIMMSIIALSLFTIEYRSYNNEYIIELTKINDTLIVLSNINTQDNEKIQSIMNFIFGNKYQNLELYINDTLRWGKITGKIDNCIVREEKIFVQNNDLIEAKTFKIKYCK